MKNDKTMNYVITIGLAAIAGMSSYFGSINSQAKEITTVDTKVQVLQKSDENQNEDIRDMKDDINYIRKVIEEQARRQGIVVKPESSSIFDSYSAQK